MEHYQDSLKYFDEAFKIYPEDEDWWYEKGRSLCGLKQYDKALKLFDKTLTLNNINIKKLFMLRELFYWNWVKKMNPESVFRW